MLLAHPSAPYPLYHSSLWFLSNSKEYSKERSWWCCEVIKLGRLAQPVTVSTGFLKWKTAWNALSAKTPQIPPQDSDLACQLRHIHLRTLCWHDSPVLSPISPCLLYQLCLVTLLFELSLFSFQRLVISEAICFYFMMSTSHLPTPSDPSIKTLWCIHAITTASQLRFSARLSKKVSSWPERKGPSPYSLSIRRHTVPLYGGEGVGFKHQPLSLTVCWISSSDACEKRCRNLWTCNWESKMRGKKKLE